MVTRCYFWTLENRHSGPHRCTSGTQAARCLGIGGADALENDAIYTQADFDNFRRQLEQEEVEPLLARIKSLDDLRSELLAKMRKANEERKSAERMLESQSRRGAHLQSCTLCVSAAAQRELEPSLGALLSRLAEAMSDPEQEL